jgi:hypothetical protein
MPYAIVDRNAAEEGSDVRLLDGKRRRRLLDTSRHPFLPAARASDHAIALVEAARRANVDQRSSADRHLL